MVSMSSIEMYSRRISVMKHHQRHAAGCVADSRGKLIVSVGWDFSVAFWNGETGAKEGHLLKSR